MRQPGKQIIDQLHQSGLVAVMRADQGEGLLAAAQALAAGGVKALEITLTTPGALKAIEKAASSLGPDCLLGAGTVLDAESARAVILAGAQYVVCPIVDLPTIEMCRRYGRPVIPGALSPTEIVQATAAGADLVKIFPAAGLGAQYLKDLAGPLPHIRLMPTGGIGLHNAAEFIRAGAWCLGVGGALLKRDLLAEGRYDQLTSLAAEFVEVIARARNGA